MQCKHDATAVIATRCFTGPVGPGRDQNPMAHGNVTNEVECLACGARRHENINGCHEELGSWGPSRAEREAYAARLRAKARRLVAAVPTLTHALGTARVDAEGYVVTDVDLQRHPLPAEWLAMAVAAREAVLAAEVAS